MPTDTPDTTTELDLETVFNIIDDVEDQVLSEDMLGASREQVAEGTCARIKRRLRELDEPVPQEPSP